MRTETQIILLVMILVIGLQWVGDPGEVELTGDWSATAGWHDLDNDGPDISHHLGLTTSRYVALLLIAVLLAGPAFIGWPLPVSDSRKPQTIPTRHRIPRAPPAA